MNFFYKALSSTSILMLLLCSVSAQTSFPSFLQGTWKVENRNTFEEWETVTVNQLKGSSFKVVNGKRVIDERLTITRDGSNIVYSAAVVNQNNGGAINFALSKGDENTFHFENTNHDFPQKITYQKISDSLVFVQVTGKDDKGFSFNMFKVKTDIPQWYLEDLKTQVGIWETNNHSYKSDGEPFEKYVLEWNWGVDQTTIKGHLFGKIGEAKSENFWEFTQYWDSEKSEARLFQTGFGGTTGIGNLLPTLLNETTVIQRFSSPGSLTFDEKHVSLIAGNEKTTTSFKKDSLGNWKENRTYSWYKSPVPELAISKIDTMPSGELMLTQTIIINASIDKLWKAYTTEEEWMKWVTPIVEMDIRINGTIKSHYDSTATIGDKGTIVNHILNYIPNRQITMQAELNENFPAFMIGEEKNLYSIVDFEKLADNKTKLTMYGLGYKNEQQWRDLLKFFIQGNELTLNKLKSTLER